ncbi:hypothetical protein EMIHUDRAFT_465135 [Emiliania huxleyi CCMP1516]|uniref:Uncharacterized protein n=2 Tax=Emiliania huxleyi TaxID=2903 RepID=A0A0D3IIV8_EMIH1|nr:hypothetical protein EMIHUDRAFT_465135 [Emiliania huxleyi CCMP1516]EOD11193.1 hypothetical protein EMIHUDRAFT_465135 [Emiliania huxleyi CCMP1516]|eukprot:XP_005763622.1 hypothetical protein EMIHUDRAFT_465135 [Emiliania huxleyi CCMP1516]
MSDEDSLPEGVSVADVRHAVSGIDPVLCKALLLCARRDDGLEGVTWRQLLADESEGDDEGREVLVDEDEGGEVLEAENEVDGGSEEEDEDNGSDMETLFRKVKARDFAAIDVLVALIHLLHEAFRNGDSEMWSVAVNSDNALYNRKLCMTIEETHLKPEPCKLVREGKVAAIAFHISRRAQTAPEEVTSLSDLCRLLADLLRWGVLSGPSDGDEMLEVRALAAALCKGKEAPELLRYADSLGHSFGAQEIDDALLSAACLHWASGNGRGKPWKALLKQLTSSAMQHQWTGTPPFGAAPKLNAWLKLKGLNDEQRAFALRR